MCTLPEVAEYVPGEFFRRELPGLLAVLAKLERHGWRRLSWN